MLVAGLLMLFDVLQPMSPGVGLLSATVAVYEMVLAVRLIAKGLNVAATTSMPDTVTVAVPQGAVMAGRG